MVKWVSFISALTLFLLPACGGQAAIPTLNVAGQPTFVLIYTEN